MSSYLMTEESLNNRKNLCTATIFTCKHLLVPNTTAAVAAMNLHKFLNAKMSNKSDILGYDSRVLISAIVFMSCKLTETQRQFRDVYNVVSKVIDPNMSVIDMDSTYCERKDQIIQLEQNVLRTLNFDLEFDLPHKYMLNIARLMKFTINVVHSAWRMLNDSLLAKECVSTAPEVLACACLVIAQKYVQHSLYDLNGGDTDNCKPSTEQTISKDSMHSISNGSGGGSGGGIGDEWWFTYFKISNESLFSALQWISDIPSLKDVPLLGEEVRSEDTQCSGTVNTVVDSSSSGREIRFVSSGHSNV